MFQHLLTVQIACSIPKCPPIDCFVDRKKISLPAGSLSLFCQIRYTNFPSSRIATAVLCRLVRNLGAPGASPGQCGIAMIASYPVKTTPNPPKPAPPGPKPPGPAPGPDPPVPCDDAGTTSCPPGAFLCLVRCNHVTMVLLSTRAVLQVACFCPVSSAPA